jgi:hypothetical protein
VQRRPLPKSGFSVWLETASGKARKRSSYTAEFFMDSRSAQQLDWPEQQSRRSGDMTRNQGAGGKPAGATGGWKASLAAVLKAR